MTKLVALGLALFASAAYAAPKTHSHSAGLTEAALTGSTDKTKGMSLAGATAYRVTVVAPPGATVTGGAVACWYMPNSLGIWFPCNPALNAALTTGNRVAITLDSRVAVPSGRLAFLTNGVTLSSGTTVTVNLEVEYE